MFGRPRSTVGSGDNGRRRRRRRKRRMRRRRRRRRRKRRSRRRRKRRRKRRRGKPRKRWKEEVERDLKVLGVRRCRDLVADKKKWKDIVRQVKAHSGL